jgi:D-alanine transaminase
MTVKDPIIYLNGRFLPKSDATMSVDERGTLYADGVYEVLRYYAGRPLAMDLHMARMRQSLEGIRITPPDAFDRFTELAGVLLEKNGLTDARLYWQITRGAAPRKPKFPKDVPPTVLMAVDPLDPLDPLVPVPTKTATLLPDERWSNCWIKSLMLLPNILAANEAHDAGYEAGILQRDGVVTEATNANAMIVRDGELWTHPADRWVLNGVTRQLVLQLAGQLGVTVCEQNFGTEQLRTADEVLLTGTTLHVATVSHIDGEPIGDGTTGPVTQRLHDALVQYITSECLRRVG